jgi:hypothetical protein
VTLDHFVPICFLSSIHIGLHALILYLSLVIKDLGSYLVSYASPSSLECHASLSIFMMLSLTCEMLRALVFHPSWREVTVVRFNAVF